MSTVNAAPAVGPDAAERRAERVFWGAVKLCNHSDEWLDPRAAVRAANALLALAESAEADRAKESV